ncbi:MAG: ABC transporter ATP-binding protein [Planctomycetes bacterium]|nr:ABC transporter ATP-binding protein [Planctomycetota bacterium]
MKVSVESTITATPRVQQLRGMFDLPAANCSRVEWEVNLPLAESPWNVGLIVGPSGCGKTTIARRWFGETACDTASAKPHAAVVDLFPAAMSIKDIVALLSAVGFSAPPAWLRPFAVLSTGQQFRVALALALATAGPGQPVVFDEYTSVVDRTVARVGSAAVARTVRQRGLQFVAVTCHEDVEDWLQPDWVYRPAENHFARRRLRRRPPISLDIVRCQASAWPLFAPHHYLSHALAPGAVCFLASWACVSRSADPVDPVDDEGARARNVNRAVAFSAWLPFVGTGPKGRREHRTVTLPDYQGVGIGNALSDFVASLWRGLGYRALSTTTHPAMIQARWRSPHWRMHRVPAMARGREGRLRHAATRLTAGFEYVGPALPPTMSRAMLE